MNQIDRSSSAEVPMYDAVTLRSLLTDSGGPIALSYPEESRLSTQRFDDVLSGYGFDYRIFAAHKATASSALLRSVRQRAGIDVASLAEFRHVQELGFTTREIVATGPKSRHFLKELSLFPDVTVVVDSENEAKTLLKLDARNPILIRVTRSILSRSSVVQTSRFGVDAAGFETIKRLLSDKDQLRGLAFHIDTQSIEEKAHAAWILSEMLMTLQSEGFHDASILDIGGGFGQTLGMDPTSLDSFKAGADTTRVSVPSFPAADERLRAILSSKIDEVTLGERLRDLLIEVWCEPGAALFSDGGNVVAEITDVRTLDGTNMIICDIHRNQMTFEDFDVPLDPLLVGENVRGEKAPFTCVIYGHLCTETDKLYLREIRFDQRPKIGDIIVFTHTGAYRSHFNASRSIGHPLASKYYYHDGTYKKDTE